MKAIIIGISSSIGREIALRLVAKGWEVSGTCRDYGPWHTADDTACPVQLVPCDLTRDEDITKACQMMYGSWDLLLFAAGTMEPIGELWQTPLWHDAMAVNCLAPVQIAKYLYNVRRPGASIVFISGPNLAKPSPSYAAYRASKAAAMFAMQAMNDETKDAKAFMLAPGVVNTKIHWQTVRAGRRAANYERVMKIVAGREPTTSHDDIFACLMWAMEQPKGRVGGRLVLVRDKNWKDGYTLSMPEHELQQGVA